jgi:hypothetical protein
MAPTTLQNPLVGADAWSMNSMSNGADAAGSAVAVCTVRRHPLGGYTPVLHLAGTVAPTPTETCISLPTTLQATQYARNHYGTLPVLVEEEHRRPARLSPVRA